MLVPTSIGRPLIRSGKMTVAVSIPFVLASIGMISIRSEVLIPLAKRIAKTTLVPIVISTVPVLLALKTHGI